MFCSKCGSPVRDQDKFCKACGTPVSVRAAAPVAGQPVQYSAPVPQPAPAVYQPPVQTVPQNVAPSLAKTKKGPAGACFVIGLITCILLILLNIPAFLMGGMVFMVGPLAMMLGADFEDMFVVGLVACLGSFLLIDMAVISIVFNGISKKITAKRPASKCRSFRTAASVMVLIDSLITVAPIICLNSMMSDVGFLYAIYAIVFIMAVIYFVLAILTNKVRE